MDRSNELIDQHRLHLFVARKLNTPNLSDHRAAAGPFAVYHYTRAGQAILRQYIDAA